MPDAAELLLRSSASAGTAVSIEVGPDDAGWEFIGLRVQRIQSGGFVNYSSGLDEVCLVPLRGTATVESNGQSWTISRPGSVFDGKPTALYLPVRSTMTITANDGDAEIAIASSRASEHFPARLIAPDEISVEIRGAGNAARQINHIIAPDFPAHRLLVVEVFTPSGNWSSFPPHKHDVSNLPAEADLEEIYYYRIDPSEGFGLQRLYTTDGSLDHAWVIRDGDLLLVPEGYHAFAVAHGYTAYYLNVLAGDEVIRTMQPSDDPSFGWVRDTWTDSSNEGLNSWRDIDTRVNAGAGQRR
ncbi:MAG: 5-deoxy-glucuronate isomerase [uncultured Thermomicrobiales bacterium]|uniref:5-deoxy-glucuronate isomerase n=1 Tax=uncultured Thermomicrobiales bacterium TaxID=1645740 RepID=A0A6J4UJJ9_9BACT|nr:MAG: 5-deoxy-glucuronate isomerase [uncultured Thermomicrobiales bacterium]